MKLLLVELLLLTLSIIDAKEEKESGVLNDLYNFLTMKFKPSSYRIRGRLRPCLWKICSRPLRKNYKLSAQEQVTTKEPQSAQKSGRLFRFKIRLWKASLINQLSVQFHSIDFTLCKKIKSQLFWTKNSKNRIPFSLIKVKNNYFL